MIDLFIKILGRERSWQLGRKLYMHSRGEHLNRIDSNGEGALVRRLVSTGDPTAPLIVWDVGANLGEYSAMVIKHAEAAGKPYKIEQFEPSPASVKALEARFRGNKNVCVHPIALSNAKGIVQFEMHGETAGINTLEPTGDPDAIFIQVETDTADSVANQFEITEVDLIKIDAEGHDLQVIRGAHRLLGRKAVKVLQFEYNFRWVYGRHFLKDVFEIAAEMGYLLGIVQTSKVMFFSNWQAENERFFEANYVLVREDFVEKLSYELTIWNVRNTPTVVKRSSNGVVE